MDQKRIVIVYMYLLTFYFILFACLVKLFVNVLKLYGRQLNLLLRINKVTVLYCNAKQTQSLQAKKKSDTI